MAESFTARVVKVEYAVVLMPGDEKPEPPFYDDCHEAQAVVMMAGGGLVVQKAYYETDWMIHEPHA